MENKMENLIEEIISNLEYGSKATILGFGNNERPDNSSREEIWGDCDFEEGKCCGIKSYSCFNFIETDENRYMVCGRCEDKIRTRMENFIVYAIILRQISKNYNLPKDIERLLLFNYSMGFRRGSKICPKSTC